MFETDGPGPTHKRLHRITRLGLGVLLAASSACGGAVDDQGFEDPSGFSDLRFEVSLSPELAVGPLDGRVILLISTTDDPEPRFQSLRSQTPP